MFSKDIKKAVSSDFDILMFKDWSQGSKQLPGTNSGLGLSFFFNQIHYLSNNGSPLYKALFVFVICVSFEVKEAAYLCYACNTGNFGFGYCFHQGFMFKFFFNSDTFLKPSFFATTSR